MTSRQALTVYAAGVHSPAVSLMPLPSPGRLPAWPRTVLGAALVVAALLGSRVARAEESRRATSATIDSTVVLPSPTGRHSVGTMNAFWFDSTRVDTLDGTRGPRQVAVQIWYPAEPGGSSTAPLSS